MSGDGKINPWIFVVVTGVLAILFAVFGLQQQTEELQARVQLEIATNRAVAVQKLAIEKVKNVEEREKILIGKLEECMKGKKR